MFGHFYSLKVKLIKVSENFKRKTRYVFSYNNGISTTASEIDVKDVDGTMYITRLYDWQIVNGGQTTASIAACLNDRGVELSKVFVPMKVSVIHDVKIVMK